MKKIYKIFIYLLLISTLQNIFIFNPNLVKANEIQPKVSAGNDFSLALKNDGTVWAWGRNGYGQLGIGDNTDRNEPTQIIGLTNIIDIKAGSLHSVALKSDGTVWAWGANPLGELGNGTTNNSSVPVQVLGLTDITKISLSGSHTLALKSNGNVWSWGVNKAMQLGNGTYDDTEIPTQVVGFEGIGYLSDIKEISAGVYHSFALKNDGTVYSWGQVAADFGFALGTDFKYGSVIPIKVENETGTGYIGNIKSIAAGYHHALLLDDTGNVYSFGINNRGQLGNGSTINNVFPTIISGLTNVNKIEVGEDHSIIVKNDGSVWSWGYNSSGQLGDNSTVGKFSPVRVVDEIGTGYLTNTDSISGGYNHSISIKTDGSVYTWGSSNLGGTLKPTSINFGLLTIPTNSSQTNVSVNGGLLRISEYTNTLEFEDYQIGLQDAALELKSLFEFSVEDFTGTWSGWKTSIKINKIMDGTKELKDASIQIGCTNSKMYNVDNSGNKIGVGVGITGDFSCSEGSIIYGTSFPLLSSQPTIETSGKHFFSFLTNFINLKFSK
jgi:alpha-tubulin suppressor-like RCC1 family protein